MNRIIALTAAVSVCAGAAMAAPPSKVKSFYAAGPGVTESPNVDGMYMAKYDPSSNLTNHHMVIHDLRPSTTYGIQVNSYWGPDAPNSIPGFTSPVAFTTNHKGKGKFDVQLPFDSSVDPTVLIFIWDGAMTIDPITGDLMVDFDALEFVTDDEVRAIGVAES